MRKSFLCVFLLYFSFYSVAQDSLNVTASFNAEYAMVLEAIKTPKNINVNTVAGDLKNALLKAEEPTQFDKDISPVTRQLIETVGNPYALVLLQRAIREDASLSSRLHLKNKLLKEISLRMNLLTEDLFPYYSYETQQKKLVNFVSIRSGNDMFTMAGLWDLFFHNENQHTKDGGIFFQRNDDRDYTGSLLIEIGTDFFRTLRRRPLKTYQTLLYGFDVYTPYFKDPVLFAEDESFNPLDRPHASFQYFGWSKKGLSRRNKKRWSTTLKLGKIGGSAGANFQNAVHQDISYSRRPRGWGAQISNDGRIGFSVELKQEFWQKQLTAGKFLRANSPLHVHTSFFTEEKLGTYMTTASAGVQISNKSFMQTNQNFINHRIRQTVYNLFDHLMYNVALKANYIKHNTMLEGYGLFNTREKDNDPLTPGSLYYLNKDRDDQVKRLTVVLNTTVSYTTRYGSIFYNWMSFSPETRLKNIGINSPASGKEMTLSKRWHHFAEIGFTFNNH